MARPRGQSLWTEPLPGNPALLTCMWPWVCSAWTKPWSVLMTEAVPGLQVPHPCGLLPGSHLQPLPTQSPSGGRKVPGAVGEDARGAWSAEVQHHFPENTPH